MKTKKWGSSIFSAIIVLSAVFACMPDENDRPSSGKQSEIEELKANTTFDWSTSKTTSVKVLGLNDFPVELSRRLNLSDLEGNLFYSGFHSISQDIEMSLELPNHVKHLVMGFGAIQKQMEITGGKVTFDFLPEVDDSDVL